jgi:hypothetical protein
VILNNLQSIITRHFFTLVNFQNFIATKNLPENGRKIKTIPCKDF